MFWLMLYRSIDKSREIKYYGAQLLGTTGWMVKIICNKRKINGDNWSYIKF